MGRPLPGYRIALLDADGKAADEGEICDRARRRAPLGLMRGYQDDDERTADAMRGGYYHTGDVARATPTATSPTSAAPTTCSRPRTTASARSSWRAC